MQLAAEEKAKAAGSVTIANICTPDTAPEPAPCGLFYVGGWRVAPAGVVEAR